MTAATATSARHGGEVAPDVLRRAKAGDRQAFTEVVCHYDHRLRALAYRLLGDRAAIDDALQEAYVKASGPGDIVVTVSGDLPRAELERVAACSDPTGPADRRPKRPTPQSQNLSRQLAGVVPFGANYSVRGFHDRRGWGVTHMELAGHGYRQLAEEIGEVLQAAAETAEKMQEDARAEAARIRAEAEAELRIAYAEGRRILDEARMEADMVRAEAEWQSQEAVAQARRQAAERMAGANTRLADIEQAEARVLDRLAGVGQLLADTMATIRDGQRDTARVPSDVELPEVPEVGADDDSADQPSAKVYFVEFPPLAPPAPEPAPDDAYPDPEEEIVLTENPGASLFNSDRERSEWAPPPEMPTWWTRDGAQG